MPVVIPARELSGMLASVLPFAHSHDDQPIIHVVHFESETENLVLVSTDRYTLAAARRPAHVRVQKPLVFDLPLPQAKELARLVKMVRGDVTITKIGKRLSIDMGAISYAATQYEQPEEAKTKAGVVFPPWREALAKALDGELSEDRGDVLFNPEFLARLAKVQRPAGTPARFHLAGALKVAVVTVGSQFTALIQPIRAKAAPDSPDPVEQAKVMARRKKGGKR